MRTALITGVTGQDGSYMAQMLVEQGVRVIGVSRDENTSRLPSILRDRIAIVGWNYQDVGVIADLLAVNEVDEIYNFAAFSSGERMFEHPVEMGDVNGLTVARILEAIRKVKPSIRFCQASSSEMFGRAQESPQSENTAFRPRTPYGAAKLYGHSLVGIYREQFGVFACSAILFNHESPRRGLNFVTRKVARAAAQIKARRATELVLETLEPRRDWGFAGDYVRAMWLMLQCSRADDYVVATGIAHSIRELCECAFSCVGLDYRDFVRLESKSTRPPETVLLVGDAAKARVRLGWKPDVDFPALVRMMVQAELEIINSGLSDNR